MKQLIAFLAISITLSVDFSNLHAQSNGFAPLIVDIDENNVEGAVAEIYDILLNPPQTLRYYGPGIENDIRNFLHAALNARSLCSSSSNCPSVASPDVIDEQAAEVIIHFQGLPSPNPLALQIQTGFLQLTVPQNNFTNNVSPINQEHFLINTSFSSNTILLFSIFEPNAIASMETRGRIQAIIIGDKNMLRSN